MQNTIIQKSFLFLLILLVGNSLGVVGQDTTYFSEKDEVVNSLEKAKYYSVVQKNPADTTKATVKIFYLSGKTQSIAHYGDYQNSKLDGSYRSYYENGQLHEDIHYKKGNIDGKLQTYWKNGQLKRMDYFKKGKFVRGKNFNQQGKQVVHTDFEVIPHFPGGQSRLLRYLSHAIKYPKKARKKNIEGTVVVQFVINTKGDAVNVKIAKSVSKALDEETIKVVKEMPMWKPGMHDGEAVNVQFSLPIRYTLD